MRGYRVGGVEALENNAERSGIHAAILFPNIYRSLLKTPSSLRSLMLGHLDLYRKFKTTFFLAQAISPDQGTVNLTPV
jgi:hypothetical protein